MRTVTAQSVWDCSVGARHWEVVAESLDDATALFTEFLRGTVLEGRDPRVASKDQSVLTWGRERKEA
jgi:hypothetical protein